MLRECLNCNKPFQPADFCKAVSKAIEAERKALGVQGVLFRCYVCSHCGHENLFVDLHPLDGETAEAFKHRTDDLQATIRQSRQANVGIALVNKRPDVPLP